MSQGVYLEIEGCDGSGKTTQARRLAVTLAGGERRVGLVTQPSFGAIGRLIREALSGAWSPDSRTLQLLFAADRQECREDLAPCLSLGDIVISDRGALSTWAYALGTARAEGHPQAEAIGRWADVLSDWALRPAAILVIDTPLETCLERVAARGARATTEREAALREIHALYRGEAQSSRLGGLVRIVDGSGSEEEVAARLLAAVRPLLGGAS